LDNWVYPNFIIIPTFFSTLVSYYLFDKNSSYKNRITSYAIPSIIALAIVTFFYFLNFFSPIDEMSSWQMISYLKFISIIVMIGILGMVFWSSKLELTYPNDRRIKSFFKVIFFQRLLLPKVKKNVGSAIAA